MKTYNSALASRLAIAIVLGGTSVLSACAESTQESIRQQVSPSTAQPSAKMNLSDANIVALLAIANQSDIEGGQLAETKASSREVRS